MMLEAMDHEHSSFVTLTYADDNIPRSAKGVPEVRVRDAQLFMKRLRKKLGQQKIRHFITGEYGGKTHRPHYHAILFNYSPCMRGTATSSCQCGPCSDIREAWGLGFTLNGSMSSQSAEYVARYVVKKSFDQDDKIGRAREFQIMSKNPGIGFRRVEILAADLKATQADKLMTDVPAFLNHGQKKWPLGPTMRRRMRVALGRNPKVPDETTMAWSLELLPVRRFAKTQETSLSKIYAEIVRGRVDEIEVRQREQRTKL